MTLRNASQLSTLRSLPTTLDCRKRRSSHLTHQHDTPHNRHLTVAELITPWPLKRTKASQVIKEPDTFPRRSLLPCDRNGRLRDDESVIGECSLDDVAGALKASDVLGEVNAEVSATVLPKLEAGRD